MLAESRQGGEEQAAQPSHVSTSLQQDPQKREKKVAHSFQAAEETWRRRGAWRGRRGGGVGRVDDNSSGSSFTLHRGSELSSSIAKS
jgi:hypothetical protein